jgi:ATP-binding cassette subfamily F protein 3
VTHDRYLIDALGTQIWEIEPDETRLTVFEGTYSQRKEERDRLASLNLKSETDDLQDPGTGKKKQKKEISSSNKTERRRLAGIQELENKISRMEQELAQLSYRLETPPSDPAKVAKLGTDYARLQYEMDLQIAEWERLQTDGK